MQGRGDWRPSHRIETLRRIAFIGDSNVYGAGVASDETLPAYAERQMNEQWPGWPVEAVNLGISGYNLWNGWLDFRHGPQVYDGVVIVLCSNDADLFGRTYQVAHKQPELARWEPGSPIFPMIERCFDDIAAYRDEQVLPVAIRFSSTWDHPVQARVSAIIAELCAARGMPYLDSLEVFRELNRGSLRVSALDSHPSPPAHEAAARHLVAMLRRHAWFGEPGGIVAAPDKILASARTMVQQDGYPVDAALTWAINALDAKTRVARRLAATARLEGDFDAAAASVGNVLHTADHRWHRANRVRAHLAHVANGGYDLGWGLWRAEEERSRLDELHYVLDAENRDEIVALLRDVAPSSPESLQLDPPVALAVLAGELERVMEVLADLRMLGEADWLDCCGTVTADLDELVRLAERARVQIAALRTTFERLKTRPIPTETVPGLVGSAFQKAIDALGFIRRWRAAIERCADEQHAPYTTILATVQREGLPGDPATIVSGHAEYAVPFRLPFVNSQYSRPDGEVTVLKFDFPLFYAGRIVFSVFTPKLARPGPIGFEVLKLEAFNGRGARRVLDQARFHKVDQGRIATPWIYLA